MCFRRIARTYSIAIFIVWSFLSTHAFAQTRIAPGTGIGPTPTEAASGVKRLGEIVTVNIYLKALDGNVIKGAVVTIMNLSGQRYRQVPVEKNYVRVDDLAPTEYTVRVSAPGFETATQKLDTAGKTTMKLVFELRPTSAEDTEEASQFASLPPKAQKEMGKATLALQEKNYAKARSHLDALQRLAPDHAEVMYLQGVYAAKTSDEEHAKADWTRTLELNPKHVRALLSLSQVELQEKKLDEAQALGQRAVEADPSSWRAYAVLAGVYAEKNSLAEAIQHSERALELGHGQATLMEPMLASLLARNGNKKRALELMTAYVADHAADEAAKKQLANLETDGAIAIADTPKAVDAAVTEATVAEIATTLPLAVHWLPPDIDEKMPPVESGAASCDVGKVVEGAGMRMQEFVANVDRYTATESLFHESINKWGMASPPQNSKFNYLVSVTEIRSGIFDVQEYRDAHGHAAEFPDGIATLGLPTIALVFHPHNSGNFAMLCEGLTRWDGMAVWQIHFRQRPDKPNNMREYKVGLDGPSHPVAMKGRAWIAADSYQVVRLETDLVATMPEIHLLADHVIIDYGPVHFSQHATDLWLPHVAEVYFDWNGRRFHRRHNFGNYLLFSVDDKQKISRPKGADAETDGPAKD
jgi:tetratricopeptide (TPR) repeat protein